MAPPSSQTAPSRLRVVLRVGVRIAITALVLGILLTRIDAHAVGRSMERIPLVSLLSAVLALVFALLSAVVRWRALLSAYGAERLPSWGESLRLYWIAMFYNLLPGAVGGDVYRGFATRHYFADGAATRSVSVVFVERVFGFAGLLLLAATATLLGSSIDREVLLYSALGLCAASGAVITIAIGRRLAPLLPAKLARLAGSLPTIERPGLFVSSILLSVVTHVAVALSGHALIHSIVPAVTLNDSMSIFPIGSLAAYFPLTAAGAGARDTVLLILFEKIGVAREDALATSLSLLCCTLIVSGFGGIVQLLAKRAGVPSASADTGP